MRDDNRGDITDLSPDVAETDTDYSEAAYVANAQALIDSGEAWELGEAIAKQCHSLILEGKCRMNTTPRKVVRDDG